MLHGGNSLHHKQHAMYSKYSSAHLHSRCSKWFGKRRTKKRRQGERKKKRQFVPVTGGIQRKQRCYRAPIKKLSVLWRWPASQPLLTTLRFQSMRLTAHSVSACLALDEASSHGAISSPKWKILLWFSS